MSGLQTGSPRLVVLGKLASGGMGTVSLARTEDALLVAVKRMHPHLAEDSHFLRMFLDEIWLTGALDHQNVVRLVGWGVDDGGPYFATEFVIGAALGELLARGRAAGEQLPHRLVAYVGARVADGLHAAHCLSGPDGESLAIVHRDVTPSNVLIGFDGSVKVTDFGVAKAAQKSTRTRTGMLKGKLNYMAPEYADGRGVDGRSDLYSLGVVMFQMLSGQRPLSGESEMELLRKIVDQRPPPIRSLVPDLDASLGALVDRLLAKRPHERARDAHHVAAELDAWLHARGCHSGELRAELAACVRRHCSDHQRRIERIVALGAQAEGETLLTQRWTAGARPDEALARRALSMASDPEGAGPPPAGAPPGTRVARASLAPAAAPPLAGEEVTAQTFAPVRAQLLGSRWGVLGVAAVGASVGAVVVALVVAAGRTAPEPPAELAAPADPREGADEAADERELQVRESSEAPVVRAPATAEPSASASAPRPAPRPAPAIPPRSPRPKVACTPAHFDYPACLEQR